MLRKSQDQFGVDAGKVIGRGLAYLLHYVCRLKTHDFRLYRSLSLKDVIDHACDTHNYHKSNGACDNDLNKSHATLL